MITIKFNYNTVEVKTISAAWNKIREIRNTTPVEDLDGKTATITLPEGVTTKRIPATILFRRNKNGKIEFRAADKVKAYAAETGRPITPATDEKAA